MGPKRPPVAAGVRADGSGVIAWRATAMAFGARRGGTRAARARVGRAGGGRARARRPAWRLRAAGWAEAFCAWWRLRRRIAPRAVAGDEVTRLRAVRRRRRVVGSVERPGEAMVDRQVPGTILARLHRTRGRRWTSEQVLRLLRDRSGSHGGGLGVLRGPGGRCGRQIHDLTIRSFGILPASAHAEVSVRSTPTAAGAPVAVGDAVFVAAAAAIWWHHGFGRRLAAGP